MRIRKPNQLGLIVRARRRKLGWSQAHLATCAKVGRPWLAELEGGKHGAPLDLVLRTLYALGCVMDVADNGDARTLPRPVAASRSRLKIRAGRAKHDGRVPKEKRHLEQAPERAPARRHVSGDHIIANETCVADEITIEKDSGPEHPDLNRGPRKTVVSANTTPEDKPRAWPRDPEGEERLEAAVKARDFRAVEEAMLLLEEKFDTN